MVRSKNIPSRRAILRAAAVPIFGSLAARGQTPPGSICAPAAMM
jgi:hypothetical protein